MPDPRDPLKHLIIQRAMADPAFRAELVADPRAAVGRLLGIELPEGLTVEVRQETAGQVCLVLPPPAPEGELSEADLAGLAGGLAMRYPGLPLGINPDIPL